MYEGLAFICSCASSTVYTITTEAYENQRYTVRARMGMAPARACVRACVRNLHCVFSDDFSATRTLRTKISPIYTS